VIGASGTLGSAVADAFEERAEVVRASRTRDPRVDLGDSRSIADFFASVGSADALICCAASTPLTPLSDDEFIPNLQTKLLGQVEATRRGLEQMRDGGSITLTSGRIPEATPASAGGALVNAGLEAFVTAAAVEMPRGVRLNAVSPGWVRESLEKLGLDSSDGVPADEVAGAYVAAVEGSMHGQVLTPTARFPFTRER
jgi:NAD(P)-dependent dehydrogenase (short-subunit alcohol dehydrogenase family)